MKMGIKGTHSVGDTFTIDAVNGNCIKLCVCTVWRSRALLLVR